MLSPVFAYAASRVWMMCSGWPIAQGPRAVRPRCIGFAIRFDLQLLDLIPEAGIAYLLVLKADDIFRSTWIFGR
jgi:hypothetical protein